MRLIAFSVENYRSITTARKIPVSDYSLLIGANNEGKSNILHALALAMSALEDWQRNVRVNAEGRLISAPTSTMRHRLSRLGYDWEVDFPVSKQKKRNNNEKSNITLEFELDEHEIMDFKNEIKSTLNGTLPLLISFGQTDFDVSVKKPGRGQQSLNKKSSRIANFVSQRIRFEYIPAIRTAESASRVISHLVEREISRLEDNQEYAEAISKIEELQRPVFDELGDAIQSTVQGFLPSVKSVKLNSRRDARYRSLRRDVEIIVDDGNLTTLERKGDGVQSLVALGLMRHVSEQSSSDRSTIIAIEEPESHLHPRAVHELRAVVETLAQKNQVVLTSHSPLFVEPNNLSNTVIVKSSKAAPAENIAAVRDALGVRFSDNLQNARMVLLVEGSDDVLSLKEIISARSEAISKAFHSGTITFDHLGGASGLRQKASFYQTGACIVQCFLDDDKEGRNAIERVLDDKTLKISDVTLCTVPHLEESELEDIYDKSVYGPEFFKEFGVDIQKSPLGKTKIKWSSATERIFTNAGKPWNKSIKFHVKNWLAEYAARNADKIIKEPLSGPLNSFIQAIEAKLPSDG